MDVVFLKGYLRFSNHVRPAAARNWLNVLRISEEVLQRKVAILKIYEELVLSTEDVGMLYFALKSLGKHPRGVLDYCLRFHVQDHEEQWEADLSKVVEGTTLFSRLDIPSSIELAEIPGFDRTSFEVIFQKTSNALEAAIKSRRGSDRLIVRALNKSKHGMLVVDEDDKTLVWYFENRPSAKIVVDLEHAEKLTGTIEALHNASSVILVLLLSGIMLGIKGNRYGLSREGILAVSEHFKELPEPF